MHRLIKVVLLAGPLLAPGQTADVQQKLEQARRLVTSGNPAEAISIYEELLRGTPDNLALVMNLAIAHFKASHYDEVIPLCEKALEARPDLVPALLFLGASHFQAGRPEKAVEPLAKVVEAQPDERNARLMLGEALLLLDRFEEAEEHLHFASESLPRDPRVWYGLERSYISLAQRYSTELERTARGSAFWHALTADMFFERSQYGLAFRHYRAALSMQELPGLHAGLAAVYRATGHLEWAATEEQREHLLAKPECTSHQAACDFLAGRYRDALRTEGPNSLYWKVLAAKKLAEQAFSRLAELPPSAQLHELKARRLDDQARYIDAAEQWRKALELAPDSPVIKQGLAVSLFRSRDLEAALPLAEELWERNPSSSELAYLYGSVLLDMERPREAIPPLGQAVKLDQQSAEAHGALGQALMKAGDSSGAIPHLKAALAADEDGTRHFQLARAYQATGDSEKAREILEKYRGLQTAAEARRRELEAEVPITGP